MLILSFYIYIKSEYSSIDLTLQPCARKTRDQASSKPLQTKDAKMENGTKAEQATLENQDKHLVDLSQMEITDEKMTGIYLFIICFLSPRCY